MPLARLRFAAPLAALLGVMHTLAFAPNRWWWLQILSLAGLAALVRQAPRLRDVAWVGYAFGLGWFLSGIWWLYISMHVYGDMPAWMAAAAVLLFSAYLALHPALAAWLWQRLARGRRLSGAASALVFGAAWLVSEWLRGTEWTGFPWLNGGYAHTDGPLAGYAPLVGVYGVVAIAATLAGLLCAAAERRLHWLAGLAGVAVLAAGWPLHTIAWTQPVGKPITVRLLQGNVPQDVKFQQTGIEHSLALYTKMVTERPAQLVVTPETAFPILLQDMPQEIALAIRTYVDTTGSSVLFGAANADSAADYTNSAFGIGPWFKGVYRYDKHHLVPFGEFIPFGFHWFVHMMNMPLGDFRRGLPVQPPMPVAGQRVAPNICYEDLFGEEIAASLRQAEQPATMLANVTNLAWFGDTIALDQHLQISRMRALESGRPMLRATNTGATAVVRPDGSVQARLPVFTLGTLQADVQGMQGLTPFVRTGNAPALGAGVLVLLAALARRRRAGAA
ncbi:apolipoprotein N-acyltransferase [Ralstonia pseudosolanacearum]|uniref:apolipoprotein N-acyltransferase n=1 Tax=Ralstonia pseudosolanacearum TaxID=1310165 RepID=UPI003CE809D7